MSLASACPRRGPRPPRHARADRLGPGARSASARCHPRGENQRLYPRWCPTPLFRPRRLGPGDCSSRGAPVVSTRSPRPRPVAKSTVQGPLALRYDCASVPETAGTASTVMCLVEAPRSGQIRSVRCQLSVFRWLSALAHDASCACPAIHAVGRLSVYGSFFGQLTKASVPRHRSSRAARRDGLHGRLDAARRGHAAVQGPLRPRYDRTLVP
jgi:hypothetical protein